MFIFQVNQQSNSNHMNDALRGMYMTKGKTVPQANVGELIDISSDDSDEERKNFGLIPYNKFLDVAAKQITNNVDIETNEDSSNTEKQSVIKSAKESDFVNLKGENRKKPLENCAPQSSTKRRKVDILENGNIIKPLAVKNKKYKKEIWAKSVNVNFDNVGGMDKILKELCELLLHVKHPEIYRHIGLPPPRGFLLHGPPGCGKTLLANAIAGVRSRW